MNEIAQWTAIFMAGFLISTLIFGVIVSHVVSRAIRRNR